MSAEHDCTQPDCVRCQEFIKTGGFITGVRLESVLLVIGLVCAVSLMIVCANSLLPAVLFMVMTIAAWSHARARYSVHFVVDGVPHSHRVLEGWWGVDDMLYAAEKFYEGDHKKIRSLLGCRCDPTAVVTIDPTGRCDVQFPKDRTDVILVDGYTKEGELAVRRKKESGAPFRTTLPMVEFLRHLHNND